MGQSSVVSWDNDNVPNASTLSTPNRKHQLNTAINMKLKIKLLAFVLLTNLSVSAQEKTVYSVGTNLPPIIGNTFTLNAELIPQKRITANVEIGIMIDSKLKGSYTKIGTGRSNHINSGQYLSTGLRYTPRKNSNQTYFFIGAKLLGGYFKQSAEMWDDFASLFKDGIIPADYEIKGDRVYSEGYFMGLAGDIGVNLKITNWFHLELGIQGGHNLYTSKRQVDNVYSHLPGIGALNFVGIVRTKFIIGKNEY